YLISFPPQHTTRLPLGRCTRAMLVYDIETKALLFVKDNWRAEKLEKEGEIHKTLSEANVPHLAKFDRGNNIKDSSTCTDAFYKEGRWASKPNLMTRFHLHRQLLKIIGKSLTEFSSLHELVSAIRDAMECHDRAYFDCKILHQDISVGNVIITPKGEGILIDWELALRMDNIALSSRRPDRTGTWQFMSAKVLEIPSLAQDIEDDHESAFWVLVWTALHYTASSA
ncbi:hypothetical protein B0H34DRAFT_627428, partial [Crassisporium funariophilum]